MSERIQKIKITCSKSDDGKLVSDIISENSALSKNLVKKLMAFGAVFQTFKGSKVRARKSKRTAKVGDHLECYFDPNIDLEQEEMQFKCLYENNYYGVYLKPAGALTEGTEFGDKVSLFRFVEKTKIKYYPVNRIDKEVEGLVVVAFDSKTQNKLQQIWNKDVIKKYQAIVSGHMEGEGIFDTKINNKFTETKYKCIKTENNQTCVEVIPTTERKMQIRIHFSDFGYPIMGDPVFGRLNKNKDGLKLISYSLEFKDPYSQKDVKFCLPKDKLLF